MPCLSRYKESRLVKVDRINKRHCAGLNLVFLKQLLQIDLPHNFLLIHLPLNQTAIESPCNAQLSLLSIHKFYGIYNIVVPLIQQPRALQIIIIQPHIPLVITHSQRPFLLINSNERHIIEMRLFRSF